MMESDDIRNRAEAIFKKKAVALREGERAMEDYKSEQREMQEKTARLKALRLTRDATQKKTGSPATGGTDSFAPKPCGRRRWGRKDQ
jgi:hypothetical protein